jgi:hypothetical protein
MHAIDYHSYGSDNETTCCLIAEFIWPTQTKSIHFSSLKLTHKNRQEEMKFTFNIPKCDRIFDKMLKNGYTN